MAALRAGPDFSNDAGKSAALNLYAADPGALAAGVPMPPNYSALKRKRAYYFSKMEPTDEENKDSKLIIHELDHHELHQLGLGGALPPPGNQIQAQITALMNQNAFQFAALTAQMTAQTAQVTALTAQVTALTTQGAAQTVQVTALTAQVAMQSNRFVKVSNSSAIAGLHAIEPMTNAANQLPVNVGLWFPATKEELSTGRPGRILALVQHYNIVVPAGAGSVHERRLRALMNYLGVRQ